MKNEEDEPVAGSLNKSDGFDAMMSPPERHAKLTQNKSMMAVIIIVLICLVVMGVALALR